MVPSSSRDCIAGWLDEVLKIKVKAPPDKGRANKAVTNVIEKSLQLSKGSVTIESGHTSCKKIISINGYDADEITARVSAIINDAV